MSQTPLALDVIEVWLIDLIFMSQLRNILVCFMKVFVCNGHKKKNNKSITIFGMQLLFYNGTAITAGSLHKKFCANYHKFGRQLKTDLNNPSRY